MKIHLLLLLVGEFLSLLFGIALIIVGGMDIDDDLYGTILGFVGIFNGFALVACFATYALMLVKKSVFPTVLLGYSCGLSLICLQSIFVWSAMQQNLFENYTETIFQMDAANANKLAECTDMCTDFRVGKTDFFTVLVDDNTQDTTLEEAGAVLSVLGLLAQVMIIASSFIMLRAQQEETIQGGGLGSAGSPTSAQSEGYTAAPSGDRERSLLANLEDE